VAFLFRWTHYKPIAMYIAIVAFVYVLAVLAAGFVLGELDVSSIDKILAMWPIPVAALGISAFGTLIMIWRFGDQTGSIYFLPTVMHVFLLLVGVIGILSELWRR
jgi:hypothetical protein